MKPFLAKWWLWIVWALLNLSGGGFLLWKAMAANDKRMFLPGETTHGHFQIEMACSECHTSFMGVKQDACIRCHGEELKAAQDSHPPSKFKDPTKGHLLQHVQADECTACHSEHNPDATHPMGLTMPPDYCAFCHQEVGENRPSHAGLEYETCATAGCHNFHDNRALYERFLVKHLDQPAMLTERQVPALPVSRQLADALTAADQDAPAAYAESETVLTEWAEDAHARAGVNCSGCHESPETNTWVERPGPESCTACHEENVEGWKAGRHGMRFAAGLGPMTPGEARLEMHAEAAHENLDCGSCHQSHRFDTVFASMSACLACHDDAHTRSYTASKHFILWQDEQAGEGPAGSGVSCATCHLPRYEAEDGRIHAQHNQNDNLRPNEKMVRSACMNCHGVEFSIEALAEADLVAANFNRAPSELHQTFEWIRARSRQLEERRKEREAQRKERTSEKNTSAIREEDL